MKSSTTLFAGLFVFFFALLSCEKENVNPSVVDKYLGWYQFDYARYENYYFELPDYSKNVEDIPIGWRMKMIKVNDSTVDIKVPYWANLSTNSIVFKNLRIRTITYPIPFDPAIYYFYDTKKNRRVGVLEEINGNIYLNLHAVDSVTNIPIRIDNAKRYY
jgi:hypothetical protein